MRNIRFTVIFLIIAVECPIVFSDTVYLKDGRKFENVVVVEETENKVSWKSSGFAISMPRDSIEKIDYITVSDAEKIIAECEDLKKEAELAVAKENYTIALEKYEKIISKCNSIGKTFVKLYEKANQLANECKKKIELAQKKYEDKQRSEGLIKYLGRWITKDESNQIQELKKKQEEARKKILDNVEAKLGLSKGAIKKNIQDKGISIKYEDDNHLHTKGDKIFDEKVKVKYIFSRHTITRKCHSIHIVFPNTVSYKRIERLLIKKYGEGYTGKTSYRYTSWRKKNLVIMLGEPYATVLAYMNEGLDVEENLLAMGDNAVEWEKYTPKKTSTGLIIREVSDIGSIQLRVVVFTAHGDGGFEIGTLTIRGYVIFKDEDGRNCAIDYGLAKLSCNSWFDKSFEITSESFEKIEGKKLYGYKIYFKCSGRDGRGNWRPFPSKTTKVKLEIGGVEATCKLDGKETVTKVD